jgi:predicted MFS family arabinose efflux permease
MRSPLLYLRRNIAGAPSLTVSSGLTIATALGVPLGTLIGYQVGWRSIFLAHCGA